MTPYEQVLSILHDSSDWPSGNAAALIAGDPYRTSTGVLMVTY